MITTQYIHGELKTSQNCLEQQELFLKISYIIYNFKLLTIIVKKMAPHEYALIPDLSITD